jgi:hypothetical protein
MNDDEVLSQVKNWLNDSLDFNTSELSHQRAESMKYYFGQPFGNELPGKSKVVTRDVQETVDWIMPSLMKVFTNGGNVVKYEPQTAEDVPQAEQETEYVNYLFNRKNPGFKIMHDWFQDTLMYKTGITKVFVEKTPTPTFDFYDGLDEETLQEIVSDPNTEVLALTQKGDGTYLVKVKVTKERSDIKIVCIPPENFIINRNATCLDDATFMAHREEKTISDLRAMGVPEDVLDALPYDEYEFADSSPERLAREAFDGTGQFQFGSASDPVANRKAWVTECYCYIDADGDGYAELRRIVIVGDFIIDNTEWDSFPFADLSAYPLAHKFHGMSVYDKIKDIQDLRSALMRNVMDNIYRQNTGRWAVLDGAVNLEDLMTNEANGIVRMKSLNAVTPLPTPQLAGDVYNMMDRLEADRGKRTGVSDRSRGLDDNTLHSNQAATSVNQLMTAAEQQIDLIARIFAETGVKRLFQLLHEHAIKHQNQEEVFELRGQWVKVNPANWRSRTDMTVTVGIGNMNKDQQLIHLGRMWEMAQAVVSNGGMGILITEQNIYNILKEMTENAGYKDVSRYWNDPSSPQGQQALKQKAEADAKPKPDDIKAQAQMATAQATGQKHQADAMQAQSTTQLQMAELELKKQEAVLKAREMSLKEDQLALEREQFQWERAKNEAEFELERNQQRAVALGDGKVPASKPRKPAAK